jgi:NAD(P)-dependent dehydrogenase (short-subunit alcohol dehydrogenase family)
MRFSGRAAAVTGSSDGIGFAVACGLLQEGAAVTLTGRDPERLAAATERARALNERVHAVCGDITSAAIRHQLVAETCERFGRLDILVNNSGGGSDVREVVDIDDGDWGRTLELNLGAVFKLCRAAIPIMRTQRYGRIVNVSSVAGRNKGRLSGPQYSAAKAGVQGLTRHLAGDLAEDGITVNAVAPGFVATARALRKWESRTAEEREHMMVQVPMRRFAQPEEIAQPILFLASEGASYITGVTLDVNGGSFMC